MIEPKEITIDTKVFILSKFPAIAGREIITQYVPSALPKVGNYKENEQLMLKLMSYVAVPMPQGPLALTTMALVDNHTGSWETLMRIEAAMMEYNCSFFQNGRSLNILEGFAQKLPAWIIKILTGLSEQLSQAGKPVSTI